MEVAVAASRQKAGLITEWLVRAHGGDVRAALDSAYGAGAGEWAHWAGQVGQGAPSIFTQDRVLDMLEAVLPKPDAPEDPFADLDRNAEGR